MKSGILNFLEPSGPLQACNGMICLYLTHGIVCTVPFRSSLEVLLGILGESSSSFGSYVGITCCERLRWSRGSVLTFGTQVRGFKPGRSRQIFKGQIKIFSTPSFGGEVKPSVPCRRFAARKRSLNVTWKSTFRQNYRP